MVAMVFDRHPSLVNRVVPAVACDVATRAVLVDVDDAERRLAEVPRRERTGSSTSVPLRVPVRPYCGRDESPCCGPHGSLGLVSASHRSGKLVAMSETRDPQVAQQLLTVIHETSGTYVPSHVTNRIALLSGGQQVRYLEAPLQRERGLVSGAIRVFTDEMLIVIDLADVATQASRDDDWPGGVTVTVVPRRSLLTLSVAPGRGGENRNDNSLWAGREVLRWPHHGELELRYEHLDDAVVVGAPSGRTIGFGESPLDAFLDSLVADLAR